MEQAELKYILNNLIATWENEVIEFKEANDNFSTSDIGKYFSALSNEANLRNVEYGWLVFGVRNRDRSVVGSEYRRDAARLDGLKNEIARNTEPGVTFRDIHELFVDEKRVVMFQIPAAPRGMPISWNGHYFARAGESLSSLGLDKLDAIRNQTLASDWTAQVVPAASVNDLDPDAVQRARDAFAQKHANRISASEITGWSIETFLDKAKLTQSGRLTRAAILLLGKAESAYLLNPSPAELTWKLVGQEQAYEHFGPPFFLNTSRLYQRIRNIQIRLLPADELIPYEIAKYDQRVVLEALHNCIAHQDYSRNGRIIVTEYPDKLTLENVGKFFEGKPEDYIISQKTPSHYRNPFLTQAMVQLNMIDTMGFGIRSMHEAQRKRYFPMPDYDITGPNVRMTIYGGVVDPGYSRLLMRRTNLPIGEVLALDRVQKKFAIPDDMAKHLKQEGLIEGRKPRFHVSAQVAAATFKKAEYIRNRSFDDRHFQDMIVELIKKFGSAKRHDIDTLIMDKLSDTLNDTQKRTKIGNLLSGLKAKGKIQNSGSRTAPSWKIKE
jgi:ATP-dependent DNA helicase RecG